MKRPHVIVNFALSADGKIAPAGRGPSKFSSEEDTQRFMEIRQTVDAIMVARGTLEADNMAMILPDRSLDKQPIRCLVSRKGNFDPSHKVFATPGGDIHLIVADPADDFDPGNYPRATATHRATVQDFIENSAMSLGIERLLCEGGGTLAKSLIESDLIDEYRLTLAGHTLIGGSKAPTLTGHLGDYLGKSTKLSLEGFERNAGGEIFLTYLRHQ
ncbi:MAG: RibD family protein [Verrucomicrobiota bacterium JB023]|nr:RibD family protein [Verrucomicrobiota bacterium JB023]